MRNAQIGATDALRRDFLTTLASYFVAGSVRILGATECR